MHIKALLLFGFAGFHIAGALPQYPHDRRGSGILQSVALCNERLPDGSLRCGGDFIDVVSLQALLPGRVIIHIHVQHHLLVN
jgi:hypothetical protein